jgi:hypothetical protein
VAEYTVSKQCRLNWAYDVDIDNRPVAFDAYTFTDDEVGAVVGEVRWLSFVSDPGSPPWSGDMVSPDLYERAIPNFGTIWYTFVLDRPSPRCQVLILLATLTRTPELPAGHDPRLTAGQRVAALRALGLVC